LVGSGNLNVSEQIGIDLVGLVPPGGMPARHDRLQSPDRKAMTKDLRQVYTSVTEEGARTALSTFGATWGKKYRYIVKQWTENWTELMAFPDFPLPMRKM